MNAGGESQTFGSVHRTLAKVFGHDLRDAARSLAHGLSSGSRTNITGIGHNSKIIKTAMLDTSFVICYIEKVKFDPQYSIPDK